MKTRRLLWQGPATIVKRGENVEAFGHLGYLTLIVEGHEVDVGTRKNLVWRSGFDWATRTGVGASESGKETHVGFVRGYRHDVILEIRYRTAYKTMHEVSVPCGKED